jgi:hypothetical protein
MARVHGWDYDALVERVVEEAMTRSRRRSTAELLMRQITG